MFECEADWVDAAAAAGAFGPPTQEEIDLINALCAEQTAALNAAGARGAPWPDDDPEPEPVGVDPDTLARRREPTADELAGHPTGAMLAFALDDVDPTRLDDYTTVELVAAWYRLTAWAQAGAARAAAELAQRDSMIIRESPPPPRPPHRHHNRRASLSGATAHEIAMRLTISRTAAQDLIDIGTAIETTLAPVGDALTDGLIDLPKTRAFTEGLTGAPLPVALAVQDTVLPGAPRRTVRQLRQDIARALISTDPTEATRRHHAAKDRRRVCHPTPLPDGMAGIWAVLPAPDAIAIDIALEAAARTATNNGDPRTTDHLRADILTGIAHTALAQGWIGATPPTPPHRATTQPLASEPRDPGAPDPDRTREASPDRYRLGKIGGRLAQIRVTIPLGILLPPADTTPPADAAPDAADTTPPADAAVAELEGYGPITPDVARAIALGGTWKRLITDPRSGAVRDIGRTGYKPAPELADLVRARDKTCIRPGCGAHAQHCDLDHTVPYHLGGHTTEANLGALCPTDHALKTNGGYRIEQLEPGTFIFTTPSGHTYRRNPDGTSQQLPRRHPPQQDDGPPPF